MHLLYCDIHIGILYKWDARKFKFDFISLVAWRHVPSLGRSQSQKGPAVWRCTQIGPIQYVGLIEVTRYFMTSVFQRFQYAFTFDHLLTMYSLESHNDLLIDWNASWLHKYNWMPVTHLGLSNRDKISWITNMCKRTSLAYASGDVIRCESWATSRGNRVSVHIPVWMSGLSRGQSCIDSSVEISVKSGTI
jgi:hypothetical protein